MRIRITIITAWGAVLAGGREKKSVGVGSSRRSMNPGVLCKPLLCGIMILALFSACSKASGPGGSSEPDFARKVTRKVTQKGTETPEFAQKKLEEAAVFAEKIGSAAVLVLHDGEPVFSYGDVTKKYMCHSIRKPLLGALYGIHAACGDIDINDTLEKLGIDDIPPKLTRAEKSATDRDGGFLDR